MANNIFGGVIFGIFYFIRHLLLGNCPQRISMGNWTPLAFCHRILMYYSMLAVLWLRKAPEEAEQNSSLCGSFISAEGL